MTMVATIGVVSVAGGRIMVVLGAREQIVVGVMAEDRIRSMIGRVLEAMSGTGSR
jgi:hypothetical protein